MENNGSNWKMASRLLYYLTVNKLGPQKHYSKDQKPNSSSFHVGNDKCGGFSQRLRALPFYIFLPAGCIKYFAFLRPFGLDWFLQTLLGGIQAGCTIFCRSVEIQKTYQELFPAIYFLSFPVKSLLLNYCIAYLVCLIIRSPFALHIASEHTKELKSRAKGLRIHFEIFVTVSAVSEK